MRGWSIDVHENLLRLHKSLQKLSPNHSVDSRMNAQESELSKQEEEGTIGFPLARDCCVAKLAVSKLLKAALEIREINSQAPEGKELTKEIELGARQLFGNIVKSACCWDD